MTAANRTPWQRLLGVQAQTVDWRERLRDCVGAGLGMLFSGLLGHALLGPAAIWLVAPMGASAVLLFAVPSSPLAQPWSVLGGNVISALIGVAVVKAIGGGPLAAALAVALALGAMFQLRCVHPPGGAAALLATLGGAPVQALGWSFAFVPVGLNALLLVAAAVAYNRVARRPRHAPAVHDNRHHTADPAPQDRIGPTPEDLDAALREFNQLVDIDRDVLEDLLRHAEQQAWRRRFGSVRCADIMSRDLVAVEFATPLEEAWRLLHHHDIQALPVLDRARRVIGIVTIADFLKHAELDPRQHRHLGQRVRRLLAHTPFMHSDKPEVVGQIMSSPAHVVGSDEIAVELVPRLADLGLHQVPVVNADRRLVGLVTQSDLIGALYRAQSGGLAAA